MTAAAWRFAAPAVLCAAIWLAAYRLPLRRPRTRQRFRLAVASRTGLPGRYVFPIAGTAIYLLLGLLAAVVAGVASDAAWLGLLRWRVDLDGIAVLLLAMLGAATLTAFAVSVLYAARPTVDVPGAVGGVRWIQEVMALPSRWRWLVPAASAGVEEFYFRGVFLGGLLVAGASAWSAIALSGLAFVVGQVLLTEQRLQALVLGLSSVVVSVVGGLLVVVEESVLPAIIVHASFAAFYTSSSSRRGAPQALPTRGSS
nr:hypothetical protein [Micromonospora sp. DSM 115978]